MPSYKITDPETGRSVKVTGPTPPSEQEIKQIFSAIGATKQEPPEESSFLDKVVGGAEGAFSLATGMIAEPIAGIAGLAAAANPFGAEGSGGQTVRDVQQALTYQPMTDKGKGAIAGLGQALEYPIGKLEEFKSFLGDDAMKGFDSPAMAAIATAIPEAIIELSTIGTGGKALRSAKNIKQKKLPDFEAEYKKLTPEQQQASTIDLMKKGTEQDIANMIQSDPKFYQAVDELNIQSQPLPSHGSLNQQYRSISGGLEAMPSSPLQAQARQFLSDTGKAADDLIERFGGAKDTAQMGLDFKAKSLKVVDDLFEETNKVYSDIRQVIDERRRFESPETVKFLEDLKSKDSLSPELEKMLKDLQPKRVKKGGRVYTDPATGRKVDTSSYETVFPKLGKIDILRKKVGQAINKKSGVFKDQETGLNKALYARLSSDIDNVAVSVGGDALDLSKQGKELVIKRKKIEDNLKTLLGKDLNKALNTTVSKSIKGLSKGEIDNFNKTVQAIPKADRGAILISSMNDVFKGSGVNQNALSPTQFVKWYDEINRKPSAKNALFGNLPKDSRKAIDSLYEVSKGISRSKENVIKTGVVMSMFNDKGGFLKNMLGSAAFKAVVGTQAGPAGSAAANVTEQFLRNNTSASRSAVNLMADPAFQNLVSQSVTEGVFKGNIASKKLLKLESKIMRSNKFKRWSKQTGASLAGGGSGALLSYLFQKDYDKKEGNPTLDFIISGGGAN